MEERIELMTFILKHIYIYEYRVKYSTHLISNDKINELIFSSNPNKEFSTYHIVEEDKNTILHKIFDITDSDSKSVIIKFIYKWLSISTAPINTTNILYNHIEYNNWSLEIISTNSTTPNLVEKLYILYKFLFNVLPFCVTNINRRHFGLFNTTGIITDEDINANGGFNIDNSFAVPFISAQTPNPKSEFSNIDITMCFTIISYLLNRQVLRVNDYDMMIKDICNYLSSLHSDDIPSSSELIKYNNIVT
jgi:hypothetical protein